MVLEQNSVKITAMPMEKPLIAEPVTANVGHKPSNMINTGFSAHNPFINSFDKGVLFLDIVTSFYLILD